MSAMSCEHANEVPTRCPCPSSCHCRSNTCKRTDDGAQAVPASPIVRGVLTAITAAVAGWAVPSLDVVNALRTLHGRPRVTSIAEHDAEVAAARTARGARD